jgi:hypothetical protein
MTDTPRLLVIDYVRPSVAPAGRVWTCGHCGNVSHLKDKGHRDSTALVVRAACYPPGSWEARQSQAALAICWRCRVPFEPYLAIKQRAELLHTAQQAAVVALQAVTTERAAPILDGLEALTMEAMTAFGEERERVENWLTDWDPALKAKMEANIARIGPYQPD